MEKEKSAYFMQRAHKIAYENCAKGQGGPFGCVIVKDGVIIAEGTNLVTTTNDPTAHAEVTAIRNACKILGDFQLAECEIYTSCEPCPMCLGAIYWARPKAIYFGYTREEAAAIGFDDQYIYDEIPLPYEKRQIPIRQVQINNEYDAFELWKSIESKTEY